MVHVLFADNCRSEEAEKERKRQEALRLEQEAAEKAKKILLAEKEKELANQNPENLCPSLPKVSVVFEREISTLHVSVIH